MPGFASQEKEGRNWVVLEVADRIARPEVADKHLLRIADRGNRPSRCRRELGLAARGGRRASGIGGRWRHNEW